MIDIQRAIDYAVQVIEEGDQSDLDVVNLAEAVLELAAKRNECLDYHFSLEPLNFDKLAAETDDY